MSERRPGDIVLVEIPYTDLSGSKKRPACILAVHQKDRLVAFITSRLEQAGRGDVVLRASAANGLAVDSAVLVWKLSTIHESLIVRQLGSCLAQERRAIIEAVVGELRHGL